LLKRGLAARVSRLSYLKLEVRQAGDSSERNLIDPGDNVSCILLKKCLFVCGIDSFPINPFVNNHSHLQLFCLKQLNISGGASFMGRKGNFFRGAMAVGMLTCDPDGQVSRENGIGNTTRNFIKIRVRTSPSLLKDTFIAEMDGWRLSRILEGRRLGC
jgi:hypothetical protein